MHITLACRLVPRLQLLTDGVPLHRAVLQASSHTCASLAGGKSGRPFKMDNPMEVVALAHREKSHQNRTKIVCFTEADVELAAQQLELIKSGGQRAPAPVANSRQQQQRRRGATARALAQAAQPLGGEAKEMPDSLLEQLAVAYTKGKDGVVRRILLRTRRVKGVDVQRVVVPIERLQATIDVQYTMNAGKKSGINSLEERVSRGAVGHAGCQRCKEVSATVAHPCTPNRTAAATLPCSSCAWRPPSCAQPAASTLRRCSASPATHASA